MSLQRQFEGPDVRMLLEEIRSSYGNEPTISRAETFRSGGVLGFFQREQFRLVVDAPDEGDRRPPGAPGAPGASNGRRSAAKRRKTGKHFASPTTKIEPLAVPAKPDAGPRITTDLDSYIVGPGPTRSTASPRRSATPPSRRVPVDLFADVADSTEDEDFVTKQPESARRNQDLLMATADAPKLADAPVVDTEIDQDPSFETVLNRVSQMAGGPGHVASSSQDSHPMPTSASPKSLEDIEELGSTALYVDHDPGEMDILGSELFLPTSLSIEDLSEIVDSPSTLEAPGYGSTDDSRGIASTLRGELLQAGFDPESATKVESTVSSGATTLAALTYLFETMPSAPRIPLRPGSLVVVVGPRHRATAEASRIAAEIGSDPSQVGLAIPQDQDAAAREELLIRDTADAMELGPSLRRGRVGVVAIDSPCGETSTVWARHVLSALRPTLVIGVVDSMYKSEDIGRWVRALDGLDALVVDRLESTASPLRVLSLGIPVLRLGDLPSTPARWVAVVADVLSDDCLSIGAPQTSQESHIDSAPRGTVDGDMTTVTATADLASYATAPATGPNGTPSDLHKQPRLIDWPQLVSTAPENAETRSAVR